MKSTVQKAAGGVALGWVPLDFIFAFCLPFFVGADISCSCVGQSMMKIIFVARNRSFLGTYMVQLTCFEWKLSHLSPAFCIWHRWRNTRFRAIYFDIRVPNLTCHQHRENTLCSANSIGSFTNFQLLVSCNGPSIPNLKMKFFYPIFGFPFSWLKFGFLIHFWFYPSEFECSPCYQAWHAANTGKTNWSFSSPAMAPASQISKCSPCYQTWHATNTGKTNCPLPSALGEKAEKNRCWPGTF